MIRDKKNLIRDRETFVRNRNFRLWTEWDKWYMLCNELWVLASWSFNPLRRNSVLALSSELRECSHSYSVIC